MPEFKADIRNALRYLTTQVKKQNIKVVEKEATAEELKAAGYDAVIVATGTTPIKLNVPGSDQSFVKAAVDVLNPEVKAPKGKIVVIGGGLIGTETAVQLSLDPENKVTIVEMLPQIMKDCSASDTMVYPDMMKEHNVRVMTNSRVVEITDKEVVVEQKGRTKKIAADCVLMAVGMRSEKGLYQQLKEDGVRVFQVGDAVKTGKIYDAIHTGYKAGLNV